MREYLVKASNMRATYAVGRFTANSPEEAKSAAIDSYRNSSLGRSLKDVGAFKFWIATEDE